MKFKLTAVIVLSAIVSPAIAFAQTSPVTRAQVKAELVDLESVGYHVGDGDNTSYPDAIQRAEAKLATKRGASAYGGTVSGASASGSPVSKKDWDAMYSR